MKNCGICTQNSAKYQCPSCRIRYCSVPCYKSHKETPCVPVKEEKQDVDSFFVDKRPNTPFETDENIKLIPKIKLRELGENKDIRESLTSGDLRKILTWINAHPEPHRAIEIAMAEPIFAEYVDKCLKIVDPPQTEQNHHDIDMKKLQEILISRT